MKNIENDIRKLINKNPIDGELEIVDMIKIPAHSDPMVRIRTLEEALDEFDSSEKTSGVSYLVQVRPKRNNGESKKTAEQPMREEKAALVAAEKASKKIHIKPYVDETSMYLDDGNLNVPYLRKSAKLLLESGDYKLAKNIFVSILKSGSHTSYALYGVGFCFEKEGNLEEARKNYEESIVFEPFLGTFKRLASVLIRQKRDSDAVNVIERALLESGLSRVDSVELHKTCGNCLLRLERSDEAERHYKKALILDPSADEIQSNLGALYLQRGKTKDAIRYFEDAVASSPKNTKALFGIGTAYLAEGNKKSAYAAFANLLEINLNNPTAIFYLVKLAYELKDYVRAEKIVSEFVDVAPVNINLLYSLAGLRFHLGKLKEARQTLNNILRVKPDHIGSHDLLERIERHGAVNS